MDTERSPQAIKVSSGVSPIFSNEFDSVDPCGSKSSWLGNLGEYTGHDLLRGHAPTQVVEAAKSLRGIWQIHTSKTEILLLSSYGLQHVHANIIRMLPIQLEPPNRDSR